jgi:aldose 1-epimerase
MVIVRSATILLLTAMVALGLEFCAQAENHSSQVNAKMHSHVETKSFGQTPDGAAIDAYTVSNSQGASAKFITYGATLTELHTKDKKGQIGDVVFGFDDLQGYLGNHPYFGATVGRYANRIAKGTFTLDGQTYHLPINNPPNSLHGGDQGFSRRVWKAQELNRSDGAGVRFTYLSKDGEEGYPGNLTVTVTYLLTDKNELKIDYEAQTDKDTVVNLTNHSYFNFSGSGAGDILKYVLYLNADKYTPVDPTLIPTGELASVTGTALDFHKPTPIGARIAEIKGIGGYDHNFVLNGQMGTLRIAARVTDPDSGREMEVWTTEPGVQFYSAIGLNGSIKGKGGVAYQKYGAICLETQHYPDSPNHPIFPSTELKPGQHFHSETIYKFSAK